MVKSSIACGLQACLGQQWTKDDYSDFTVVVDDQEFQCHKFILGACSTFLNGLMRSDMIENNQHRVVLTNVSKETFTVILNGIYKGEDGLTVDNVIQVWNATHLLDIAFLIEECEEFVMKNITLSNYGDFYCISHSLNSEKVLKSVQRFMMDNFEDFQKSTSFYKLSFEEFLVMVDDHFLQIKSEDIVVDAILNWVKYHTKKPIVSTVMKSMTYLSKEQTLVKLLKAARLCLASRECLEKLMENPLICSNPEALKIVHESLLFHWQAKCYGSNYIVRYRECSGVSNVMAFVSNGEIKVYSIQRNCFYKIYPGKDGRADLSNTKGIAALNSKIYLNTKECGDNYSYSYKFFDTDLNEWVTFANTNSQFEGLLLSHQDKIIFVSARCFDEVEKMTINTLPCLAHVQLSIRRIYAATIFNGDILVFCSSSDGTEFIRYNMMTQAITKRTCLDDFKSNMASFQQDQNVYILQENGSLLLVVRAPSDNITFKRMANLWKGDKSLKGVVCYAGQLFVFCDFSAAHSLTSLDNASEFQTQTDIFPTSLPGVFTSIRFIYFSSQTQVIPMTMPSRCLNNDAIS